MQQQVILVLVAHDAVRSAICDRIRASFLRLDLLEACSLEDAFVILENTTVDVVLVGTEASGASVADSTRAVLDRSPRSSVIALGTLAERSFPGGATRAGASAMVSKRRIGTELVPAVARFIVNPQAHGRREAARASEVD